MTFAAKPIRIAPAFEDREHIRALFAQHAPYRAIAAYAPDGVVDEASPGQPAHGVFPWFRGNWAVGGKALVDGAEPLLHHAGFLEAARTMFATPHVYAQTVVVNVNAPMPAGVPHVDIPAFRGATREAYPLPFLKVMGASGLFERWRILEAGAVAWFYEGAGGSFEYWPDGLEHPMRSEVPPFGNVAIVTDSDRMFHRIAAVGDEANPDVPRISAAAEILPANDGGWAIVEGGELRATYPARDIRLSLLWKAEVREPDARADLLTLDRIVETFATDLRGRAVSFGVPADPARDKEWLLLLQRQYAPVAPS